MMRRPLTTPTRVAIYGSLALLMAGAVAVAVALGASNGTPPRGRRLAAKLATALSPAADDLALAEIRFAAAGTGRVTGGSLKVAASPPFGDDYLAAAALPGSATGGAPVALVLLVNRPSPLLDPVSVRVRGSSRRSLGAPTVRELTDPFSRPRTLARPALCDLRLRRRTAGRRRAGRAVRRGHGGRRLHGGERGRRGLRRGLRAALRGRLQARRRADRRRCAAGARIASAGDSARPLRRRWANCPAKAARPPRGTPAPADPAADGCPGLPGRPRGAGPISWTRGVAAVKFRRGAVWRHGWRRRGVESSRGQSDPTVTGDPRPT